MDGRSDDDRVLIVVADEARSPSKSGRRLRCTIATSSFVAIDNIYGRKDDFLNMLVTLRVRLAVL
jgi:hypothetical protein